MGTIVRRFDTQDSLDDKIDQFISVMSKLTAQGNNQKKQFKPMIYQGRQREQSRYNYDQGNYQNRYRLNSRDRRTPFRGRGQYGQNYRGRPHYVNTYRNDFRRDNFRETQNYRCQNVRGGYRRNYRNDNFGRGRSRSRDRQYSGNFSRNDRSSSSESRAVQEPIDRIRCFNCREYDHFAKDCANSQTEKEPEQQLHQMYTLDEERTALKVLATDTYDNLIRTNSVDTIVDHLNL